MKYNSLVDAFFEHPLLGTIIEEAIQSVESDDDPIPSEEEQPQTTEGQSTPKDEKLQQLAADLKQGHLDQEDLINMFKSGRLSKEEIQQIVDLASDTEDGAASTDAPTPMEGEQQPSQEELMAQQIEQTNDMFVKFAIYDKVSELTTKLNYFQDNFNDVKTEFYERVLQLKEFLNILSSLIFNLETDVAYQMYGSILLQLTELFDDYNQQIKEEQQMENIEKDSYGNS